MTSPSIVTAREGTSRPFDIYDTPVTYWHNMEDLKKKLQPLVKDVKHRLGRSYKAME